MATNPPPDLVLTSLRGDARTVGDWLTVFHLVVVAVNPYSTTSAWIVPTAGRILTGYQQADCRVAWLVTGFPDDARLFLGRWADEILTFIDPDGDAARVLGLEELPALVHLAHDGTIVNAVEGWDALQWRAAAHELSKIVGWSVPVIPGPHDPGPFKGDPVPEPIGALDSPPASGELVEEGGSTAGGERTA